MAKWEDVIDRQVDLYQFWRSPLGQKYADGYVRSVGDSAYLSAEDRRSARILHGDLADRAADFLYAAEPIWVDPDMMTLVEAAAEGFRPEPLDPTDLPTPNGFLYLPRPVVVPDIKGKRISYRAVSWKTVPFTFRVTDDNDVIGERKQGVWMYFYHQRGDIDDYEAEDPAFRAAVERGERGLPDLTLAHGAPWVFGETYFDGHGPDEVAVQKGDLPPEALAGIEAVARFLGALFRVMGQTIAVRTPMRPSRAFRKRAEVLKAQPEILVVTLRKRREDGYPADGEHDAVEWSHRWLVSGHWRNQWYPSLNLHRQVWIGAYVKGPEDLPLVIRPHRVFRLAR